MKSLTVFAGVALALSWAPMAQAANPLQGLVSNRGAATVEYERAVGKRTEFEQLSTNGPSNGVGVTVVSDTPGKAGQRVADAYVQGLHKVLPQAALLSTWHSPPLPQFVAEIDVSTTEGKAGESEKMIMAAQGTTCMMVEKKLQCTEIGTAPNPMGKKGANAVNPEIAVKIRLYRHDREGSAAPVTVFEDSYSVSYVPSECPDPALAAATVARLLGESVLGSQAVNISFPTTPRQLSCNVKG